MSFQSQNKKDRTQSWGIIEKILGKISYLEARKLKRSYVTLAFQSLIKQLKLKNVSNACLSRLGQCK